MLAGVKLSDVSKNKIKEVNKDYKALRPCDRSYY